MTHEDAGERWEVGFERIDPRWEEAPGPAPTVWAIVGYGDPKWPNGKLVAFALSKAEADRIVADHNARLQPAAPARDQDALLEAVKALRKIAKMSPHSWTAGARDIALNFLEDLDAAQKEQRL